jgi:predicted dehydrogenase
MGITVTIMGNTMKRLKIGVIGLGRMGQHHCRVYANQREAQLAGLYDINTQLTKEFSNKYDVPFYTQLGDLLDQVDAVSIATPTPTHFDLVMQCLERNIHVLVEKPVTEYLVHAERLAEVITQGKSIVQVGHIERFNPTYLELKKVLETLKVIAINFRRLSPYRNSNTDVDVVLDLMVHDLDLSLDLTGGEPTSTSAFGVKPFSKSLDHVVAQLGYAHGPLITLTASRVTEQKIRAIDVTAEDAFIEADFLNKSIYVHRGSTGEYTDQNRHGVRYRQESVIERILVPNAEPLALEIRHFLQCITDGCTPCVSLNDGLKALRLALHIRDLVTEQNRQYEIQSDPA